MAGEGSSVVIDTKCVDVNNGTDLLLYQFYTSYCSQKVVLALNEKKLKFKSHIVDLLRGEQFEPWFMKLNPKAEVPVLKDGVKIIPDSNRIIDYLEDNFSNGDTPRLMPEKGSEQSQRMKHMKEMLDKIPIELVTYGCFCHPELTDDLKLTTRELKLRTGRYSSHVNLLDEYVSKYGEFQDQYITKKQDLQRRYTAVQDIEEVKKALDGLEDTLDAVEKELASHVNENDTWWLCDEKFTIADITLSIFLNRLRVLGLWKRYCGAEKRPYLNEYFKRVQQREAFRKTVNQNSGLLGSFCCLGTKNKILITVGGSVLILGLAGFAIYLYRRMK